MDGGSQKLPGFSRGALRQPGGRRSYVLHRDGGRKAAAAETLLCFSEGFYAIANAEYYGLTGEAVYRERAREASELIYRLNNGLIRDPAGLGPKTIPETRTARALADPMIYLNILHVLRRTDPAHREEYDRRARECTDAIFRYHFHPELAVRWRAWRRTARRS